ncbi:zf-HC2 domain-containing protein [Treponema sp. TIM-1]|uniref:anti-sigma factor family protein n=1 Tax=Treponema sp. TIM-1 TaxID=2898417 RepID=UPI00398098CA
MCPNRQILSVYYDKELPSPWREKMEAHLALCPECRKRLEQYRSFFFPSAGGEASAVNSRTEEAKTRVWQNLAVPEEKPVEVKFRQNLWRRSIVIPLPLAAAMAALLAVAFTLVLLNRPTPMMVPQEITAANGIGLDLQGITPVSDIRGVLQYLSDEDDIVILRLPESKSFMSYGEPLYIRAEDYSRSTLPR